MLQSLEKIFELNSIETDISGNRILLHSNTSRGQGLFIQKMFELAKPQKSIEVGFAYGISTLFILEMHRNNNAIEKAHVVIEPDDYWGNTALYNIEKENLDYYLDIQNDFSDKVLTKFFHENRRFQFAYIDTTKVFDIVLQDFYFINKTLDVGGIIVLDDCGGAWPGVQSVARFINTLPHYKFLDGYNSVTPTFYRKIALSITSVILKLLPYKKKLYPTIDFKSDVDLGLNFSCIAFQKISEDTRNWDWNSTF
jgi:predicted O-methyltransferase YrrM